MAKFFGFYNEQEHCYTTINIDKIIVVKEKTHTIKEPGDSWFKTIPQGHVLVEVGEVVQEYILAKDQYDRLMDRIK